MTKVARWVVGLAAMLAGASCGDPVDVAGDYTVALTNKENGCDFSNWTVGQTTSGVQITVTQSGSDVTAIVGGLGGTFLNLAVGSATFTGSVNGETVSLKLFGTRNANKNQCSYTVNAEIIGKQNGDLLSGVIDYKTATNGSPDCGALQGCVSTQEFNGTRPPR